MISCSMNEKLKPELNIVYTYGTIRNTKKVRNLNPPEGMRIRDCCLGRIGYAAGDVFGENERHAGRGI